MEVSKSHPQPAAYSNATEKLPDAEEALTVQIGDVTVPYDPSSPQSSKFTTVGKGGARKKDKKSSLGKTENESQSLNAFSLDSISDALPVVPTSMKHPDLYSAVAPPAPPDMSLPGVASASSASERRRAPRRRKSREGGKSDPEETLSDGKKPDSTSTKNATSTDRRGKKGLPEDRKVSEKSADPKIKTSGQQVKESVRDVSKKPMNGGSGASKPPLSTEQGRSGAPQKNQKEVVSDSFDRKKGGAAHVPPTPEALERRRKQKEVAVGRREKSDKRIPTFDN